MDEAFPRGHGSHPGSISLDFVPVQLAATGVDIDLGSTQPTLALPEIADGPEEENNGSGKILLEEALGSTHAGLSRRSDNSRVELSGVSR